jgi:hypothetical protein
VYQITKSNNKGIDNIRDVVSPLEILKNKFSRDILIREQKQQFDRIYNNCLASPDFEFEDISEKGNRQRYKLIFDLLMIQQNDEYKIYVPDKLIGVLLAYTHLLGHLGTGKMLKNMQSYHFPAMYTTVKSFASKCYSCFLMHGSSRKHKIGTYPVPEYPMEEVGLDLIENLNSAKGYRHILVAQDALTDYVLLFPLRSKTAGEVGRVFKYGIFQNFNIKRLHTDNGPCFRNGDFLNLMAELKVEVLNTSVNNPSARGKIEREVAIVKKLFKKFLATSSTQSYHWENLPLMVSIIMNHVVSPRTGFKPATMMFGEGPMSQCFMDMDALVPRHHSIRNNKKAIIQLSAELRKITEIARETIITGRQQAYEALNDTRINKEFKKNDIVFIVDRSYVQGAPRPLRTKFSPSPYIVIKSFYTTVLIMRLADNFKTLVSKDDLKKYKGTDPAFNDLPREIKRILINDFKDLVVTDFDEILRLDELDIPPGIELYENSYSGKQNKRFAKTEHENDEDEDPDDEGLDSEQLNEEEEENEDDEWMDPDSTEYEPRPGPSHRKDLPSGSGKKHAPPSINQPNLQTEATFPHTNKHNSGTVRKDLKNRKHIQINSQLSTIEEEPTLSNTKYKKKIRTVEKTHLLNEEKDQIKSQNETETSPTAVDQASKNVENPDSEDEDDSMKLRSGRRVHFRE